MEFAPILGHHLSILTTFNAVGNLKIKMEGALGPLTLQTKDAPSSHPAVCAHLPAAGPLCLHNRPTVLTDLNGRWVTAQTGLT